MESHGFFSAVSDALMIKALKRASEDLIRRRFQQLNLELLKRFYKELEGLGCYNEAALINEEIAKRKNAG